MTEPIEPIVVGDYVLSDSLEIVEDRVGCKDCLRSEYINRVIYGAQIRHSRYCDANGQAMPIPKPKPKPVKRTKESDTDLIKAAKAHRDGYNVDSDTVYDAYKAGHLSMSDAMNSDF